MEDVQGQQALKDLVAHPASGNRNANRAFSGHANVAIIASRGIRLWPDWLPCEEILRGLRG